MELNLLHGKSQVFFFPAGERKKQDKRSLKVCRMKIYSKNQQLHATHKNRPGSQLEEKLQVVME